MPDVPSLSVLHPEWYHGHGKRPPFFEGWYYKLVDATGRHRYAIIPGIFLSDDPDQHHAFVQILDGVTGKVTYHRYPAQDFHAAKNALDVYVGPNHFARGSIRLDVESADQTVHGEARFEGLTPWPVTLTSPGIMGWYSWVPFMECYHGVLSLDHALQGRFSIDGQDIDWTGGRGYIEKDWGMSFPSAWVWMQSNHFAQPGTSLTASVAIIPWLFRSFRGMIVGLWHGRQLYRFATYTDARIEHLEITETLINWTIYDQAYRLEIRAAREQGTLLRGPSRVDMGLRVPETLQAKIDVRLTRTKGGRQTVFEGQGRYGGLEVAGDLDRLLSKDARDRAFGRP